MKKQLLSVVVAAAALFSLATMHASFNEYVIEVRTAMRGESTFTPLEGSRAYTIDLHGKPISKGNASMPAVESLGSVCARSTCVLALSPKGTSPSGLALSPKGTRSGLALSPKGTSPNGTFFLEAGDTDKSKHIGTIKYRDGQLYNVSIKE
jgi:hypothetical protein